MRSFHTPPQAAVPAPAVVGSVRAKDYVTNDTAEGTVMGIIIVCSEFEEAELEKKRRRDTEIDNLLFEQGFAGERATLEKQEEWRRLHAEQDKVYVDLVFEDSDED